MPKVTVKLRLHAKKDPRGWARFNTARETVKSHGLKYSGETKEWTGEVSEADLNILKSQTDLFSSVEDDTMANSAHCTYPGCNVSLGKEKNAQGKPTGRYFAYPGRQVHYHNGTPVTKSDLDRWAKPTEVETEPEPISDPNPGRGPFIGGETVSEPIEPTSVPQETAPSDTPSATVSESIREQVAKILKELAPGTMGAALSLAMAQLDSAIDEKADSAIAKRLPVEHRITYTPPSGETVKLDGHPHPEFAFMFDLLQNGHIPFLYGPAGSGKTTAAMHAAKLLGVPYYATSFGIESGAAETLGFINANGDVVRTQFREAWEHGGLWLGDEADAGPGDHMIPLNMALANGHCSFPDGVVERHPNFYCVLGANTAGSGGTDQYQRHMIDAATKNRFATIRWEYDEVGEVSWAGEDQKDWTRHVQNLRHAAQKVQARTVVISPRASIDGARFLRRYGSKYSWAKLDETLIWQGCDEDERRQIEAAL